MPVCQGTLKHNMSTQPQYQPREHSLLKRLVPVPTVDKFQDLLEMIILFRPAASHLSPSFRVMQRESASSPWRCRWENGRTTSDVGMLWTPTYSNAGLAERFARPDIHMLYPMQHADTYCILTHQFDAVPVSDWGLFPFPYLFLSPYGTVWGLRADSKRGWFFNSHNHGVRTPPMDRIQVREFVRNKGLLTMVPRMHCHGQVQSICLYLNPRELLRPNEPNTVIPREFPSA